MNNTTDNSTNNNEIFCTPALMKKIWAAQIEVLTQIDLICKKNNIQYFADWGTLLGAARHNGFIPWDDDIDITMLRNDYNRFIEIMNNEDTGLFQLNAKYNIEYNQPINRILNSNVISFKKEFLDKYHQCPFVVGVDIFPLDDVPGPCDELKLVSELVDICVKITTDKNIWDGQKLVDESHKWQIEELERMSNFKFTYDNTLRNQIIRLIILLSQIYNNEGLSLVSYIPGLIANPYLFIPKSFFYETIYLPFENIKVPAPLKYESILEIKYGKNWNIPTRISGSHNYAQSIIEQINIAKSNNINCDEFDAFIYDVSNLN